MGCEERWAGEPTPRSLPGDVESEGHSDLEHSDTFRLLHGFEHSDDLLDRPDL